MVKKIESLLVYRNLFRNWWIPALARYVPAILPQKELVRFRDGRAISFRPASDRVALGEVFVVEGYKICAQLPSTLKTVWDVGGNIGCFTVWASRVFPEASFTSFEPCADTFAVLSESQAANPDIRWKVEPFGLSCRDEVCQGRVPNGFYGQTSRFAEEGREISLPLRSIDQVWKEAGTPQIDLLKVDCEGGEYDIFLGCSDHFLSSVQAVIMEVHTVKGRKIADLNERLKAAGFAFEPLTGEQGVIFCRRP